MKNPAPCIRKKLFALLDGAISYASAPVPVYENEGVSGLGYQILIKEYADADSSNKQTFVANATQTIEIVSEQKDSTRKAVDTIGEEVMDLIKPTPSTTGIPSNTDWQVFVTGRNLRHLTEDSGDGSKIVRLIIQFDLLIIER